MKDVNKELKMLYKDALYFHYMSKGCHSIKAKYEVKKLFGDYWKKCKLYKKDVIKNEKKSKYT